MKKITLLIIVILISVLAVEIYSEDRAVIDSGECGDNLTWTLYDDGELVIEGTGDMWDYGEKYNTNFSVYITSAPWGDYVEKLSKLTLSDGITSIGNDAFYMCNNLTGSLTIPNCVTKIGYRAFSGCNFVKDLYIPDSVTIIGQSSFYSCGGFSGTLTLGNGVTSIEESAFSFCGGLTGDLIIPDNVTRIGKNAFSSCVGLSGTLSIGDSVAEIGENAFSSCGFTGDLIIPKSVTLIAEKAFDGCANIKRVYFKGNAPIISAATNWNPSFDSDIVTLYYRPTTTGWTDSEYYDEAEGTWNGYKLEVWDVEFKYSLSGIVTSYNPALSTTITLIQNGEAVYTYSVKAATGVGAVSQKFIFADVKEGVYDIVITKSNHLSYTIKGVSVYDDIDLREHENPLISAITLIAGDVNGDGCVDLKDVTALTSSKTYGLAFDEAETKSGDINGDGCFDLKDLAIITSDKNYGKAPITVAY